MKIFSSTLVRSLLLITAFGLVSCGKASNANSSASIDGLTITISGPAFDEPQTFIVPSDSDKLSTSMSQRGVGLQLRMGGDPIVSASGQHRFDSMILRLNGGVGEYNQDQGVEHAWFSFTFNIDQEASPSASMDFNYSKGERQPVVMVIESLEDRTRVVGHFTARVQRTNSSSTHEFYDIVGRFDIHKQK